MSGVLLNLADAADDAAISELLALSDLPGWISLSYRAAPGAHGLPHPRAVSRTLVARDGGRLAGMVTRSVFPGVLNGHEQPLSYLSQFRVAPFGRRRVKLLQQAFEACRTSFAADPPWSFASLVVDNSPATRLLTSGLPGFPRFTPVGRYETIVLRSLRAGVLPGIRHAGPEDMPEVAAFHRSLARPLAPVLAADDLAQGRWPGLVPEDVLLAERGGRLAGLVALWDQRRFRQLRVTGYRRPLAAVRGVANLLGPLTGYPHLPRVGDDLALGYLSFLSVAPGEPGTALHLIEAGRRLAGARGLQGVALGLAGDDPLLPQLRERLRCATYGSCIYTVSWQDGAAPSPGDFVGQRPDIGLL